ncbi:MAG TPA: hypothetical protein VK942_18640 [Actinomycetes bacterium]|jgi:hypothetical protein|nr:hypothetical protein [Actinomycetes bacterium]
MAKSIHKVVAKGPEFDVTVHWMDNGGVRITLPDGPWAILGAFTTGKGASQIRFVKVEEGEA